MELELVPEAEGAVQFHSRIIREEFRESVRLLEKVGRSDDFLAMCGWCKKIELPDGSWVEVEVAIEALELFAVSSLPQISHGICAGCKTAFFKELELPANCPDEPAPRSCRTEVR